MAKSSAKKSATPRSANTTAEEKAAAKAQVREDPLAHLRGHPNHEAIVEATRAAQEEAVARRDEGQALVEEGWSIVGAEENAEGEYSFLARRPGAAPDSKPERVTPGKARPPAPTPPSTSD